MGTRALMVITASVWLFNSTEESYSGDLSNPHLQLLD